LWVKYDIKRKSHETNLSAEKTKKIQSARILRKNEHKKWPKCATKKKGKGTRQNNCLNVKKAV